MALIQAKASFVRFSGPDIAVACKMRGGNAGNTRPSRMQTLVPCALIQKLLTCRGCAAHKPLRHGQLMCVESIQPARLQRA